MNHGYLQELLSTISKFQDKQKIILKPNVSCQYDLIGWLEAVFLTTVRMRSQMVAPINAGWIKLKKSLIAGISSVSNRMRRFGLVCSPSSFARALWIANVWSYKILCSKCLCIWIASVKSHWQLLGLFCGYFFFRFEIFNNYISNFC